MAKGVRVELFGFTDRVVRYRADVVALRIEPLAIAAYLPSFHAVRERNQVAQRGVADDYAIACGDDAMLRIRTIRGRDEIFRAPQRA